MSRLTCLVVLFLYFVFLPASAETNEEAENNIRNVLSVLIPDETINRIRTTPFSDLYEVLMGPNIIYISGDGRYVLKGELLDMQQRVNLTENERAVARKTIFAGLQKDEFIEFSPKAPEHTIYVFTDIDCSYCRRLHRDVPVLNESGISVRYLAFPRGGMGSNTANMMEAVWCADDRKQALTDAKNGKKITSKQCPNPVEREYLMGQQFGVRGTPAIYTEDGEELSGYVPPAELLKIVNNREDKL